MKRSLTLAALILACLLLAAPASAMTYFQYTYNTQGPLGVPNLGPPYIWITVVLVTPDPGTTSITITLNTAAGPITQTQPVLDNGMSGAVFAGVGPGDVIGAPVIVQHSPLPRVLDLPIFRRLLVR